MPVHRRPRQRPLSGTTARTAVTIALAGAASATGFDGTGHAEPQPTAAQARAKVNKLYEQAEVATEQYNGAKEEADKARERLEDLRDEAARRAEGLNSAREKLGSVAAAQYRGDGIDPAVQLALSDDPDAYLDGAAFAERIGSRQASDVANVRKQLREIERLRGAARIELSRLSSRQADLKRHRGTITGRLGEARRLLARLPEGARAELDAAAGAGRASRSGASAHGLGPVLAASSSAQAPSSRAAAALSYAYGKLGSPYVWGATGPDAFDCSGLTQAAYRAAGVSLPRTTYAQIGAGQRIARSQLLPGDLVFFYSGISHVGIYVGNGQMIHAPRPGTQVRVAPLDEMPFAGATRVA
ncbi:C40 family peptidase [Streptomyces sp. KM273126]|uniref:C40 family peptidase n=1 Tax=Streptomyces sp. KM273126 TaxID=2545247 RepID=UPI001039CC3F|nr:C40 family peptidase [Streptomyces sp. KM273126]MBA2808439.1 C40 family peptidase [Streptomyces sp. KM273126]